MAALVFNLVRNLYTVFHSDCPSLHSHQQCTSVPPSPHPHQYCYFFWLFDKIYSNRCEVIPHVVLICISLMSSDVEPLFKYHVGRLCVLGKISIQIACPFLNCIDFLFLPLNCTGSEIFSNDYFLKASFIPRPL